MPEIKNYLINQAQPGKWLFPSDVWSDQRWETLITNAVKAKFLDFLPQEIPYKLKVKMELFEDSEGNLFSMFIHALFMFSRL